MLFSAPYAPGLARERTELKLHLAPDETNGYFRTKLHLASAETELELQLVSFSSQALERTELRTKLQLVTVNLPESILRELKLQNETSAVRSRACPRAHGAGTAGIRTWKTDPGDCHFTYFGLLTSEQIDRCMLFYFAYQSK